MNKAEVIHAGWAHRDSPNLRLLDVCHADVRDTLVLEKQLESYKEGIPAPGNGPSFAERKRRQHARQLQKAKRIGKEMFEDSENGHVIDPSSSYQPPRNKKRKGKQSGGNQSKGKVTVNSGPVAYGDTPKNIRTCAVFLINLLKTGIFFSYSRCGQEKKGKKEKENEVSSNLTTSDIIIN